MIPILYKPDENNFTHGGIGYLPETISCIVTEERNGIYELELQYPISGEMYTYLKNAEDHIIKAKPNDTSQPQPFRIYKSSKPINGIVSFFAEHKSYELTGNPIQRVDIVNRNATDALNAVLDTAILDHEYTAYSTIDTINSTSLSVVSARAALGGVEGSILDTYGGEFEFDKHKIILHKNRGRDTGIKIAYGKNLTDAKQEKSISETYTGVFPYAKYTPQSADDTEAEEIVIFLPEKIISSQTPCRSTRILMMDFTDKFKNGEEITAEKLRTKAQSFVNTSGFDRPSVNMRVSFVNLWQSPEYEKFALLERLNLCDIATVVFEELFGVSVPAKVIKTRYDTLAEKYLSISLGDARANFADTIKQTVTDIQSVRKEIHTQSTAIREKLKQEIANATELITGQKGGFVVLNPPENPQEILVLDKPDIETAVNVWRWNSAGLGFSKKGYNGPYELAMTMDGAIVADRITAGELNGSILKAGSVEADSISIGYKNQVTDEMRARDNIVTQAFKAADALLLSTIADISASLSGEIEAQAATVSEIAQGLDSISLSVTKTESEVKKTVNSITAWYYKSTSATTLTGGTWTQTTPAWTNGTFIWFKTVTTKADGTKSESAAVCITGSTGAKGDKGSTGASGESDHMHIRYSAKADGSNMSTTPNDYMGVYSGTAATAPTTATSYKWYKIRGDAGGNGAVGVGISTVIEQYYLSTSSTAQSGGSWSATMPTWIAGRYLWTRSSITYTDTTTKTTTPCLAGAINSANETAATAKDTANNIEIGGGQLLRKTNTNIDLSSSSNWANGTWRSASSGTGTRTKIQVTDSPNANIKHGWQLTQTAGAVDIAQDKVPITAGQEYTLSCYARHVSGTSGLRLQYGNSPYVTRNLDINDTAWQRYSFTFVPTETNSKNGTTNIYFGNSKVGTLEICGEKFERGNKATDWTPAAQDTDTQMEEIRGKSIAKVDVLYALATSSVTAPTSGWQTTAPAWVSGKYMWQKTEITYGDGTKKESAVTCISGATGTTGATGAKGDTGTTGAAGKNGTNGKDAIYCKTIPTATVFNSMDGGDTFSPGTITIIPYFQNCAYNVWQYSTNGTSWTSVSGTTNNVTVNTDKSLAVKSGSTLFNTTGAVTFKLKADVTGIEDSVTLTRNTNIVNLKEQLENLAGNNEIAITTTHDVSAALDLLKDSLKGTITETWQTYYGEEFEELTQQVAEILTTVNEFSVEFTTIEEFKHSLGNAVSDELSKYMRFTDAGELIIGRTDSKYQTMINNESFNILDGGNIAVTFSQDILKASNGYFSNSLQIGNIVLDAYANGVVHRWGG